METLLGLVFLVSAAVSVSTLMHFYPDRKIEQFSFLFWLSISFTIVILLFLQNASSVPTFLHLLLVYGSAGGLGILALLLFNGVRVQPSLISFFLYTYLLWGLASVVLSGHGYVGAVNVVAVLMILAYVVIFNVLLRMNNGDVQGLLNASLWGLEAICFIAAIFALLFGGVSLGGAPEQATRLGMDTYFSPSLIGLFAGCGAMLVLIEGLFVRAKWVNGVLLGAGGIMVLSLFLSFSKSSIIAFIVSSLLVLVALSRKSRARNALSTERTSRRKTLGLLLAFLVVVGGGFFLLKDVLIYQFESYFASSRTTVTLTGRTLLWAAVIPMIGDELWLGHGYGTTRDVLDEISVWGQGHEIDQMHNAWLQSLLEVGVMGTAALLLLILASLRRLWKTTREASGVAKKVCAQLFCVLIFLTFRSLSEASFTQEFSPEIGWLLLCVLGARYSAWMVTDAPPDRR